MTVRLFAARASCYTRPMSQETGFAHVSFGARGGDPPISCGQTLRIDDPNAEDLDLTPIRACREPE